MGRAVKYVDKLGDGLKTCYTLSSINNKQLNNTLFA